MKRYTPTISRAKAVMVEDPAGEYVLHSEAISEHTLRQLRHEAVRKLRELADCTNRTYIPVKWLDLWEYDMLQKPTGGA